MKEGRDIEFHKDCAYDYLELSDPIRRLCGDSDVAQHYVSSSNVATVTWHTDKYTTGTGWILFYEAQGKSTARCAESRDTDVCIQLVMNGEMAHETKSSEFFSHFHLLYREISII